MSGEINDALIRIINYIVRKISFLTVKTMNRIYENFQPRDKLYLCQNDQKDDQTLYKP